MPTINNISKRHAKPITLVSWRMPSKAIAVIPTHRAINTPINKYSRNFFMLFRDIKVLGLKHQSSLPTPRLVYRPNKATAEQIKHRNLLYEGSIQFQKPFSIPNQIDDGQVGRVLVAPCQPLYFQRL